MSGPYRAVAAALHARGWSPLPLPAGKKWPPPEGFTGRGGLDPDLDRVLGWAEERGDGNVCARLPRGVVGIDVDAYPPKRGGETLAALEAGCGPLPATWTSTSRDDGVSGIRLYRVPDDYEAAGEAGPDVEVIQRHHRYAVCAPSAHPEGRAYRWLGPDGAEAPLPPPPSELPELPAAWLQRLADRGGSREKADLDDEAARELLGAWLTEGEPEERVQRAVEKAAAALFAGGSRHETARGAVAALVRYGAQGRPGVRAALGTLQRAFAAATGDRDRGEWPRLVRGAVELVAADPGPEGAERAGDGFLRLSDVAEREIEWYWPGRIAHANVVLLAGDGGVGKSTLAQELGARMTRGQAPPGGAAGDPRGVVILTAEEDTAAVVRPRMRLMGADLERVTVLDPDEAALTLPSGAERLEARCAAEEAGLLVVDTGPAFLDRGLKSNSEEDIRRFFAPLRAIAERQRLVVVVLAHLNKDTARAAQHRIMGGAAWRNVARQVLLVGAPAGADPRETGERLVAVEKNNLGAYPAAVAFTLAPAREDTTRAVVAWGREVAGVRAGDLVAEASPEERSDREAAVEFLRAELADGPRPVSEIKAAAESAALGWATVRKAKAGAGVRAEKARGRFAGEWFWTLVEAPVPEVRRDESHFGEASGVSLRENPVAMRDLGDRDRRSETPPGHVSLRDGNGQVAGGWREVERLVDEPGLVVAVERRNRVEEPESGTAAAWAARGRCPTCELPRGRRGPGEPFCRCGDAS